MCTVEDEVRRVESEWGEAFERRDLDTLNRLMDDQYIVTDPLEMSELKRKVWQHYKRRNCYLRVRKAMM
jgi:ketosteroid isomerase-like protein